MTAQPLPHMASPVVISVVTKTLLSVLAAAIGLLLASGALERWHELRAMQEAESRAARAAVDASVDALALAVWNLDERGLAVEANSLIRAGAIFRAVIEDDEGAPRDFARPNSSPSLDSVLQQTLYRPNTQQKIGTARFFVTYDDARMQLRNNLVGWALSDLAKIIGIAGTLVLVVHRLVTRRLARIAQRLDRMQSYDPGATLAEMPRHRAAYDEIDVLVGAIDGFRQTCQDEMRRRVERETELSHTLAAIDLAQESIHVTDADRRIVYVNKYGLEIAGIPLEELRGKRWASIAATPDMQRKSEILYAAADANGTAEMEIEWVRASDGAVLQYLTRRCRLPSGGYVTVATDITERKKIEDERRALMERQAQTNKMEALGRLASGVAHDFNNILGAIQGFSQFLVEDLPVGSTQRGFASRVLTSAERGRSVVRQIMAYSRSTVLELEDVRVGNVVKEIHNMLQALLPSSTALRIDDDVGDVVIRGDKAQLVQVLLNLCINANDALGGRPGDLTIVVRKLDRLRRELGSLPSRDEPLSSAEVTMWNDASGWPWLGTGTLPCGDSISISICDTGEGMSEATLGRIFEPFYTTKDPTRGTGLGLAVVHKLVAQHGGGLLVTSRPGEGSVFEVILPTILGENRPSHGTDHNALEGAEGERSAEIIVVDDEDLVRDMIAIALTRMGFRVFATNDPLEAIAAIRDAPTRWSLVMTDQTMPHMTGTELVLAIKAIASNIPCIVCSGLTPLTEQKVGLRDGPDAYLEKPIDFAEFSRVFASLVASREGLAA